MQIEYTGRHIRITNTYRALCEEGLERVSKLLDRILSAHVILSNQKHRHQAEIAVEVRGSTLVGRAESSSSMEAAISKAFEKTEAQARRSKQKDEAKKRSPKAQKSTASMHELELAAEAKALHEGRIVKGRAKGAGKSAAKAASGKEAKLVAAGVKGVAAAKATGRAKPMVAVTVHSFPSKGPVIEPHVVRSLDSIAMRPMTLEEAVKEAEFRDREVFVFRSQQGIVCVLHRKRDGKMELIEVP